MERFKVCSKGVFIILMLQLIFISAALATPSTHIWSPSTDIQPYGKVHLGADYYFPVKDKDHTGAATYVQQVYGPVFSLLSDKPEDNLLGKLWSPLGHIMAETGFDYKKGFGSFYDTYPWYFHYKLGVQEDAYFKNMPALAIGTYDWGTKHNKTDYRVWYMAGAKTITVKNFNLGRFSAGFFNGNAKLLRDKNADRDNIGPMFAWERTISEISDKLWVCVDYQGTQSSYGAMNYGFAWNFTKDISAIAGYEIYNNPNLRDTITLQLDINF